MSKGKPTGKGADSTATIGSSGMFVQSVKFDEAHGVVAKCEVRSASVEGKSSRPFVIRSSSFGIGIVRHSSFGVRNLPLLALRGIEATAMRDSANKPREAIPQSASEARDNFGPEHADTFRRDLDPDLRADSVLADPPFNDSDWLGKDDDVRWQFGTPPKGNATDCGVQNFSRAPNLRTRPCPVPEH